ncbi:MAG TPA: glycosyltransferase family 39 protein [Pyrinomonadaceae bacterium]
MTAVLFALSSLVALAFGFLFVSLLWPAGRPFGERLLLKLCLAAGFGYGLTSCLCFVWLLMHGRADRTYLLFEAVVLALLLAGVLFRLSRARGRSTVAEGERARESARARARERESDAPPERWGWLFTAFFGVSLASTALAVAAAIVREPHGGGWDAWGIYGLRARAIFRGGENWREGFSALTPWSHPDYPLLLPLSDVRSWLYCGGEVAYAQSVLSAIFTLATAGLLYSALAALRGRAQGYLAGVVLMGFTTFIVYGSSAYADVPVMFFFTATLALFALHFGSGEGSRQFLILAGVAAGLAAWTKNEGLLFVAAVLAAHLAVTAFAGGRKTYARQLFFVALGLLPVLAVVVYFKTWVAPPSELTAAMGSSSALGKIFDYHRYVHIVREFLLQLLYYRGRGVNLTYLLAIYLVCAGVSRKHRSGVIHVGLTLCLMLAGYFWVYLTTPYELVFHVRFSMDRLLLQLWPGFLLLYFLAATAPEEAFGQAASGGRLRASSGVAA